MANIPTLRWSGPADATANDVYDIYADMTTANVFELIDTWDATTPYASPTTTLVLAIEAEDVSLQLTDAANFSNDDSVMVDREPIVLDGKSGNTFATCTRAAGKGLAEAHAEGATVTKLHEEYVHSGVVWNEGRSLIRYRVVRRDSGGDESVAAQALAYNLPKPDNTDYIVIFVPVIDTKGYPVADISVSLIINDEDNITAHGEMIYATKETKTTAADGMVWFQVAKDSIHRGGDKFTIAIGEGTPAEVKREFLDVPDLSDAENLLAVGTVVA